VESMLAVVQAITAIEIATASIAEQYLNFI
jgi:hypothetical protein